MNDVSVIAPREFDRTVAETLAEELQAAVDARGSCRFALAGGSTPRRAYERLSRVEDLPWDKVEVFFGDERCVPPDDAQSNYRMAQEALLGSISPAPRVRRIEGELGAQAAARRYEEALDRRPLDLVLLGMGEDGHTASLFPGDGAIGVADRWVASATSPKPPVARVTLTLPALTAARCVIFAVSGAAKAERLEEVFRERREARPRLPAARVRGPQVRWLVDTAAAPPK